MQAPRWTHDRTVRLDQQIEMRGSRRGRPGSLPQTLRVLTTPSSSITSLAAHTMHGNMDTLNCYWQPKEQARLLQRGKRAGSPFFIHSELSPAPVRRLGDRTSCHMCALCKSVQALLKYSPQIHRSRHDRTRHPQLKCGAMWRSTSGLGFNAPNRRAPDHAAVRYSVTMVSVEASTSYLIC